jgi:glucose-6-phosphate-specific signal transduction histidine kinase
MQNKRSRAGVKDDAIRATLQPLAPNQRPKAVTVACVVAVLLVVTNLFLMLFGLVGTRSVNSYPPLIVFSCMMLFIAHFMWRGRYWSVLCFQAFLAITVIVSGLSLLVASNVKAVVLSLVLMIGGATLFWFLVRPLAQLQMRRSSSTQLPTPRHDSVSNRYG